MAITFQINPLGLDHLTEGRKQMREVPTVSLSTNMAFILYYSFKVLPMLIGAFAIWLGYKLFILGVTGQASLSVESQTVSGQLLNAAPGLFFAVGGIVAVIVSVWKGVSIDFETPDEEIHHKHLTA
jgi:hypothetical protein